MLALNLIDVTWLHHDKKKKHGLQDPVTEGEDDAFSVGCRFILHSSFTRGQRWMVQQYQDTMAICR